MKPLMLVLLSALFSVSSMAQEDIPQCSKEGSERPFLFGVQGQSLSKLPNLLFVAKKADLWIESESSGFKLWVTHNFKSGQKEFNCATIGGATFEKNQKNFSFFGPVIFDRTSEQKEGSTVWQFQVLVRGMQLGIWNQKSSLVKIDKIMGTKGASSWRWVEDGMGAIRLFNYDRIDGHNSILVIDLEKADSQKN